MNKINNITKADFFISHASEDKENFVRALADRLIIHGSFVFYDEYSIKLGDSLTDSINKGIANANNAIIILSKYFFEKNWTNSELQALLNRSIREDFKLLIIYHEISYDEVAEKYPLLADIKAIESKEGVEKISLRLLESIGKPVKLQFMEGVLPKDDTNPEDGFSIGMRIGFPFLDDDRFQGRQKQVVFDLGRKNVFRSRFQVYVFRKERIFFELLDAKYRRIGVSADISQWKSEEIRFIFANLDIKTGEIYLQIDSEIVDELTIPNLELDKSLISDAQMTIGCSLEISDPCPFLLQAHMLAKSRPRQEANILFHFCKHYYNNNEQSPNENDIH